MFKLKRGFSKRKEKKKKINFAEIRTKAFRVAESIVVIIGVYGTDIN